MANSNNQVMASGNFWARCSAGLLGFVLRHPLPVVVLSIIAIMFCAAWLPSLEKDTRANAFLAESNPALVYSDKIKHQFGLSDPIIFAVVDELPGGIYKPATLALIQWLSDEISDLPNIDGMRTVSLATAKDIAASPEGMEISRFLDGLPQSKQESAELRRAVNAFPLYAGNLVSEDGRAALLVAELIDDRQVEATYQEIMALLEAAPQPEGVAIHVAGEGALSGFLGRYIEADAVRLNPLAWLVISLIMVLAFWRLNPALLANVVLAASILITLGAMAWNGTPFYIVTSALPAILIGISVADSIHIYTCYFERQARNPTLPASEIVKATMQEMWRPITLTTFTTMAGFLGLYYAAYMPPFKYFGLFAALGVFIAWLYSLVFLPAALALSKPMASARFVAASQQQDTDRFGRLLVFLGRSVGRRPRFILCLFGVITALGFYAASELGVDEDPLDIIHPSEPLYRADKVINRYLNGTNPLDVVIETPAMEGLLEPANMRRIEALQAYAQTLPHVKSTVSYVDYLKQMNRALNGGAGEYYRLPDSREMAAQYFLVYSATSDPTDFEEEIDYNYQMANLRIMLNTTRYSEFRGVVESLQVYVEEQFNAEGIHATLSGRVSLNYHWIRDLGRSHFAGLAVALIMVWGVSTLLLGSVNAGLYSLVPVAGSVLFIYAAMVLMGVSIGVGTSMFAAVAIGLGVDFSIHTLDRLRVLMQQSQNGVDTALDDFYKTTGRALLFNFLAISCGFGVLLVSKVSTLNNFGAILVVSVTTSFVLSITVLPAMIKTFRPGFIFNLEGRVPGINKGLLFRYCLVVLVFLLGYLLIPKIAQAESTPEPDALELVERLNALEDGDVVTRKLTMKMVDSRGKERVRETINYRKYVEGGKRTVMFYLKPANIRDTAFLIWDYADTGDEDDQWLYLPALRKVRRVSAADRGDYFLGTDFTYEDMKLDGKLSLEDYDYAFLGSEELEGVLHYKLESVPKSAAITRELGYSKVVSWVDPNTWVISKAEFWDAKGRALKTLQVSDVRKIQDIWTRHELLMVNHQTGHKTHFNFSEVDYLTPIDDELFSKRALERGH